MDQQDMFQAKQFYKLLWALILGLMFSPLAFGAQNTQVSPIGYSQEGRYFSYEEYGLDEGTNEAYAKVYVIDLVQLSQVVGTPLTYAGNLNDQSILDIRAGVRAQANVFLKSLQFDTQAVLVASIGDGHVDLEKSTLTFGLPVYGTKRRISGKYQIVLESFETIAASDCASLTDRSILGINIHIENFGAGREVYTDKTLSRSRGCPTDYEIYGVALPFGATDISKGVGLISVITQESDGPNRHFLAIPLGFGIN